MRERSLKKVSIKGPKGVIGIYLVGDVVEVEIDKGGGGVLWIMKECVPVSIPNACLP